MGTKRKMQLETIGEIKIRGMQSFKNYEKVNPVEVSIKDSEIKTFSLNAINIA